MVVEFLPSGGMFQFSFQFAQALAQAGHRVQLLTGPEPELTPTAPNLEVVPMFPTWHPNVGLGGSLVRRKARRIWRALLLVESWRRVLHHLRRTRPDVVQFGELRYPLDSASLLVVARLGRAGTVVDVAHNPLPYDVTGRTQAVEKTGRLTRALLARAYRACDLVLVLGEGPRTELQAAFPDVRRVTVCGHGDYSAVLDAHELPAPADVPPHLLFFGAWTKYKNIPLMLDAFARVRAEMPQARLTLAGPVMPDVDELDIVRQAEGIGGVDLRPGYVAMEDLPDLFGSHRAVVFTYATVNISGSVHMAYTFGRPVVATDVGSMRDAVEEEVTGLLAAPESGPIAEALLRVLRDPGLADRMGRAASRRVHDNSTWSGVVERAVTGYLDALQGH
ncbi:glycosyltransferase family 4 protein [Kocuria flava]|nr:glycosyltransferase family 4 protein [Kocuria flava]